MKAFLGILFSLLLAAGPAAAQTCGALPYSLTNGTTADATQVMANFDALLSCINDNGLVNAGTAGQVGYYSSTGSAISGESLSAFLDSEIGSAQGGLLYRSASGWTALPTGTAGYVLQTNGPSMDPSWVSPGGGGGGISTIISGGISSSASSISLPETPVISRPALSALTWLNQASATATDNANGPLVLRTTQDTGGNSINALIKPVAGSDWTVTAEYALGNHTGGTNLDIAGLIVYNSITGRLYICGLGGAGSINVWAYNNTTSWNDAPGSKVILVNPSVVWTRAQYVSSTTTLTFSYSVDGFTWESIYTTSAPFVGVPTNYGVAVGTQGNSSGYVLSLNYLLDTSP